MIIKQNKNGKKKEGKISLFKIEKEKKHKTTCFYSIKNSKIPQKKQLPN